MSWQSLRVIAVRLPEETGVIISQPVVRDTAGDVFIVRDVTSPDPLPNTVIDYQDIESGRIGPFLSIEERPAQIGFLSVIASPEFAIALNKTNGPDIFRWENLNQGLRFAYASIEDIRYWRSRTMDAFLSKAEEEVKNALRKYSAGRGVKLNLLEAIDLILTQLGYITDGGSPERKRMYLLWCVFLFTYDSTRWPVVEDLAMRELGIDALALQNEMRLFRQRLVDSNKRLFSPIPSMLQLFSSPEQGLRN